MKRLSTHMNGKDIAQKDTKIGFCAHCGYPLWGLICNQCPECGKPFDPQDPHTMNMNKPTGRFETFLLSPIGWPTWGFSFIIFVLTLWLAAMPGVSLWLKFCVSNISVTYKYLFTDSRYLPKISIVCNEFLWVEYLVRLMPWLWIALGIWWMIRILFQGIMSIWVHKYIHSIIMSWRRWVIPPLLLTTCLMLVLFDVPFVYGFTLYRKSFVDIINTMKAKPVNYNMPVQWVGIFPVTYIYKGDDGNIAISYGPISGIVGSIYILYQQNGIPTIVPGPFKSFKDESIVYYNIVKRMPKVFQAWDLGEGLYLVNFGSTHLRVTYDNENYLINNKEY